MLYEKAGVPVADRLTKVSSDNLLMLYDKIGGEAHGITL